VIADVCHNCQYVFQFRRGLPLKVCLQGTPFLVVIFRVAVSPAVEQLVGRDFGQHLPKMVDSDHDVTSIRRSRV